MASPTKSAAKRSNAAKPKEATALLRADHQLVSELFAQFENTRASLKKKALVDQICTALTVHAQVEEEIFYPAFKQAVRDKELVPEATIKHATLKALIGHVEGVQPVGEMYDAKIKVLSEYVKHHVKEEQNEIFPKAISSSLDLVELGVRMAARKEELMAERT